MWVWLEGRRLVPLALAVSALALAAACLGACRVSVEKEDPGATLRGVELVERLPKEPLAVWIVGMEDPLAGFNETLDFVELMVGSGAAGNDEPTVEQRLQALDEALGISIREDLLAHVGSELGVALDLQQIDPLVTGAAGGKPDLPSSLGGSGVVFLVTDEEAVKSSLDTVFETAGARRSEEGDLQIARFPIPGLGAMSGQAEPPSVAVYYGVRNDAAALGLSDAWVQGALDGLAEEARLTAGADFVRVFETLDDEPQSLSYLNLPKLRTVIDSSAMLKMVLSSNPQARKMMDVFLTDEAMGIGIGQTVVELEQGARTTSFGPTWMAGGPKMMGLLAATGMQNLVEAVERGRRLREQQDLSP
jgi:hypothetical protein